MSGCVVELYQGVMQLQYDYLHNWVVVLDHVKVLLVMVGLLYDIPAVVGFGQCPHFGCHYCCVHFQKSYFQPICRDCVISLSKVKDEVLVGPGDDRVGTKDATDICIYIHETFAGILTSASISSEYR